MLWMLSAYSWMLELMLMLVIQRCGHRFMLLPLAATSASVATSANSQLVSFADFLQKNTWILLSCYVSSVLCCIVFQ